MAANRAKSDTYDANLFFRRRKIVENIEAYVIAKDKPLANRKGRKVGSKKSNAQKLPSFAWTEKKAKWQRKCVSQEREHDDDPSETRRQHHQ